MKSNSTRKVHTELQKQALPSINYVAANYAITTTNSCHVNKQSQHDDTMNNKTTDHKDKHELKIQIMWEMVIRETLNML